MSVYSTASYWMFLPEVWVIVGILLIVTDFTVGADLFLLPVGASALVIAALIQGQESLWFGDTVLFETWRQVIIWFAVLSVVSIAFIKFGFQRRRNNESDINKY